MSGDLIDDDPDVGAAVSKILAKGPEVLGDRPEREDRRENRTDREPHEMAEDGEVDDNGQEPVEAQAEPEDEDQFFEIPGETEDAEPVKIPLSEAAEAVKQFRQMQGDVATAVIRAETEAQQAQDKITTGILSVYQELRAQAETAIQAMYAFLPVAPDRGLLQTDPQSYYEQKAYHDDVVAHIARIRATVDQAKDGEGKTYAQANDLATQRENERLARYIPEWKEETTRAAKREEILGILGPKYGLTKADLDEIVDHRAWRVLADVAKAAKVTTEAPAVRKAVQEKAAKIVNGKMPPREKTSGRFVSEASRELKATGSENAFARKLMASGALKGL